MVAGVNGSRPALNEPVTRPLIGAPQAMSRALQYPTSDHRSRLRILLLDTPDSALARLGERRLLDIVHCTTIEHALQQVEARRPDAILLAGRDDTAAVLSRLRSARPLDPAPVIVVTTRTDQDAAQQLLDAGAEDLVVADLPDVLLERRFFALARERRASAIADGAASDLARMQRAAGLVQWRFDPDARTFRWTHEPLPGLSDLAGEGMLEDTLLRWVHLEDRARVAAALSGGSARLEYRVVLADGKERLLSQECERVLDARSGRACLVGVAHDVTELRTAEQQLDRATHYDGLTSMPNRAHASRYLEAAIASARRRSRGVTVMVLGLDRFRRINDRFGHATGNTLLREMASRLVQARDELTNLGRFGPFVARVGADEFAVIVADEQSQDATTALFRAFCDRLEEPYRSAEMEVVLSASAGVASFPADGASVEALFANADSAMHAAKEQGPSTLVVFDADVKKRLDRKLDIENRLRHALATGTALELHYQPKVEVPSGRVRSVEALLRWNGTDGGPISPIELVSVAEDTGLIHPLGDWILRTACEQAKAWAEPGANPVRIAVNISARQFGAADFLPKLERVLAETALPARLLELEITEGVMMADAEAASRVLARVKELGLRISLDDFGTGFSSLAYLTRFPIDTLKIDRSFVVGIGVTQKSETIISAIMALSRSLDIEVVAEGVETEAQRRFLERQGPLDIQGWLFSKALPADAAARWIENSTRAPHAPEATAQTAGGMM